MENKFQAYIKPTLVLFLICLAVAAALGGADLLTRDRIAEQNIKAEQDALAALVPGAEFGDEIGYQDFTFRIAKDQNGEEIARVFTVSEKGYGGAVKIMTAVAPDATVLAVGIVDVSSETVGLGQKAAEDPAFAEQFVGKEKGIGVVKTGAKDNEIQALTGATITSKAVTAAVNKALDQFAETQNYAVREGD